MKLLIVGDSISEEPYRAGGGLPGWTARYRALCADPSLRYSADPRKRDYDIDALTFSGQSYLSWLDTVQNWVAKKPPDWTIVMLGTNDLTGGPPVANTAELLTRATAMWTAIRASGSKLAVSVIPPIGFAGPTEVMRIEFNDLVMVGQGGGLSRTTLIERPIDIGRWVSQAPAAPSAWRPGYGEDTLHPSGAGSIIIGDVIWATFEQIPERLWWTSASPGY